MLICSFWFKCFYNSLKAPPVFARERSLKAAVLELWFIGVNLDFFFPPLAFVKLDSPAVVEDFSLCFGMELGTSHPHCQHRLGSTVVHTLLNLLLPYRLDQPTNYSHFSAHSFDGWREEGGWGRRSATGCLLLCAAQLVINLSSFIRTCPLLPVYCR